MESKGNDEKILDEKGKFIIEKEKVEGRVFLIRIHPKIIYYL